MNRTGTEYGRASYRAHFIEKAELSLNDNDLLEFFRDAEIAPTESRQEILCQLTEKIEEWGRDIGFEDRDTFEYSYDNDDHEGDDEDHEDSVETNAVQYILSQFFARHPELDPDLRTATPAADPTPTPAPVVAPAAPPLPPPEAHPTPPTNVFPQATYWPSFDQVAATMAPAAAPVRTMGDIVREATERLAEMVRENAEQDSDVERAVQNEAQQVLNEVQPMPFPGN